MMQELYEPLWEGIYERSKTLDFRIRSIWIADASHQGTSGVINEHNLGNDREHSKLQLVFNYSIGAIED